MFEEMVTAVLFFIKWYVFRDNLHPNYYTNVCLPVIYVIELIPHLYLTWSTNCRCTVSGQKYSDKMIFLLYIPCKTTFFKNIIPKSTLVRFGWFFLSTKTELNVVLH
jgi:hypothetical protein